MITLKTLGHLVQHAQRNTIPDECASFIALESGIPRLVLRPGALEIFIKWADKLLGADIVAEGGRMLTVNGKLETGERIEVLLSMPLLTVADGHVELGEIVEAAKHQAVPA